MRCKSGDLLDALDKTVSFDLPETLVKDEAEQIARNFADEENTDKRRKP